MEPTAPGSGPKPSKVEAVKLASQYLKTQVADEIGNGQAHFSEDAASILKFHGSYQQDDRDLRPQLKREKKEKAYQFMVRVRMVGGKMTADQFLACHELARTLGNGTLRITTREEFQLHGVLKEDLAATIRRINEVLLSTLAACGDVERNVLCCPAPVHDSLRDQLQGDAHRWAAHAAPRSSSYWEIWLDGEKIESLPPAGPSQVATPADDPVEPLYGKAYLPRKFKTAFAFPEDNCTDIHANDLGFLAVVEGTRIVGYNVLVGGGLGTTPSAQKTFPFLAVPLCFVDRNDILKIGEGVLKVFRDFGNRSDRKRARLKYIIHDWGLPAFRAKIEEYLGHPLAEPRPIAVTDVDDHLGWREQGDGKLFLGIPVENGRIKDDGSLRLFSGLRAFFEKYRVPGRLTCQQSILLTDLDPAWRGEINAWLEDFGIATIERISTVRRWSMACPALPTCGLAVTEAERLALGSRRARDRARTPWSGPGASDCPDDRLPQRLRSPLQCRHRPGGPVGPRGADGRPGPGTYTIFLGGRTIGDRLNLEFKDYVPHDRVVAELIPVFQQFKTDRRAGETFGEFCARVGVERLARTEE